MHLRDAVPVPAVEPGHDGEHQAGVSNGPGKWPQGDQGLPTGCRWLVWDQPERGLEPDDTAERRRRIAVPRRHLALALARLLGLHMPPPATARAARTAPMAQARDVMRAYTARAQGTFWRDRYINDRSGDGGIKDRFRRK